MLCVNSEDRKAWKIDMSAIMGEEANEGDTVILDTGTIPTVLFPTILKLRA